MTTLSRRLVFALCLFLVPSFVIAQKTSADSDQQVTRQLFDKVSFGEMLEQIPQEMHTQFSQNPFGLNPSQNNKMMDQFSRAFKLQPLLADAREAFQKNYNPTYGEDAAEWMNSPNGKKILKAEEEFYTLQGIRKRIVNKYELEKDPPAEERIQMIQDLAQSRSAAESEVESKAIIFRGLITAFGKLNPQQTFNDAQIDGFVSNFRNQIQSQIDQSKTQEFMLMFHGLNNKVLRQYLEFCQSKPGAWLYTSSSKSMHAAYQSATDRFLKSIQQL